MFDNTFKIAHNVAMSRQVQPPCEASFCPHCVLTDEEDGRWATISGECVTHKVILPNAIQVDYDGGAGCETICLDCVLAANQKAEVACA